MDHKGVYLTNNDNGELVSSSNPLPVDIITTASATPDSIIHGSKAVTTAGTRVQLNGSLSGKEGFAYIRAKSTNTGNIYVGGSTIDNTSIPIPAGKHSPIPLIDDLSKIWIDSDVNGEGVNYTIYYIN